MKDFSHVQLLNLMFDLGYDITEAGCCFGFSFMFMQAALVGDMPHYLKRLERLAGYTQEEFAKKILPFKNGEPIDDELEDIIAFFDGIYVSHQGLNSRETGDIHQNIAEASKFCLSKELVEKGGITEKTELTAFTGAYSKEELSAYLSSLKESLQDVDFPVMLILHSGTHVVPLLYEKSKWVFGDVEKLPPTTITDIEILAKEIFSSLEGGKDDHVIFNTEIYACAQKQEKLERALGNWQETETWQKIQTPTSEKINAKNAKGSSWLLTAVVCNDIAQVRLLLEKGANVNQINNDDYTPLHIACQKGNLDIIKALLENSETKVNEYGHGGYTPLLFAVWFNQYDTIDFLLKDPRIDVNTANEEDGNTPVHFAVMLNKPNALLSLLRDPNIDLSIKNSMSQSPLRMILNYASKGIDIGKLLNAFLNFKKDKNGDTLLHLACKEGDSEIIKLILDNPNRIIEVNAQNNKHDTPLQIAVKNGDINLVVVLLGIKGIDLSIQDAKGQTALDYAKEKGMNRIVDLISKAPPEKKQASKVSKSISFSSVRHENELKHEHEHDPSLKESSPKIE